MSTPSSRSAQDYVAEKSDVELRRMLRTRGTKKRRRGKVSFNPWEKWELALLGKQPDSAVARKIGRSLEAVSRMRKVQGIPALRARPKWTAREDALLGKFPDRETARRLGRAYGSVRVRRLALGIAAKPEPSTVERSWKRKELALFGKETDREIALKTGRSLRGVTKKRLALGVAPVPAHRP